MGLLSNIPEILYCIFMLIMIFFVVLYVGYFIYENFYRTSKSKVYDKKDISVNVINNENTAENVKMDRKIEFDFNSLGIGGLTVQMKKLVEDVLLSRFIDKDICDKYDIKHEKGVILYGHPGTGKTLIARTIAKIIPNSIIIIINGPELQSKWYGETASNIRKIFEPAKKNPDKLFILVFDEIDAIAMKRLGTNMDYTGNDLTQLLTMIDGVIQIPNIFIVGITNKFNSLDSAITRSGRLGNHIEIPLPDEQGREEILKIYLKNLLLNNALKNIDLKFWAKKLEGYSGADIECFVNNVKKCALQKSTKIHDKGVDFIDDNYYITNDDFDKIYNSKK